VITLKVALKVARQLAEDKVLEDVECKGDV
jgi:hypothetical protein